MKHDFAGCISIDQSLMFNAYSTVSSKTRGSCLNSVWLGIAICRISRGFLGVVTSCDGHYAEATLAGTTIF
jgi:hypothetical protein